MMYTQPFGMLDGRDASVDSYWLAHCALRGPHGRHGMAAVGARLPPGGSRRHVLAGRVLAASCRVLRVGGCRRTLEKPTVIPREFALASYIADARQFLAAGLKLAAFPAGNSGLGHAGHLS